MAPQYQDAQAQGFRQATNYVKTFVHVRGDFLRQGEEVRPGFYQRYIRSNHAAPRQTDSIGAVACRPSQSADRSRRGKLNLAAPFRARTCFDAG